MNVRNLACSCYARTWLVIEAKPFDFERMDASGGHIPQSTQRLYQRSQSHKSFTAEGASVAESGLCNCRWISAFSEPPPG